LGDQVFSYLSEDARQLNFPQIHSTYYIKLQKHNQEAMFGILNNINISEKPATIYEELDSFTKINELINKYPRIDKEWTAQKQVSQWLFDIRMPNEEIIAKFVQNKIDGYALLMLEK